MEAENSSKIGDFSHKFTIFTDGSALNNKENASAGWAIYIPRLKKLMSKHMIGTNNQAELEAIRYALWWVNIHISSDKSNKDSDDGEDDFDLKRLINGELFIFTDSEYSMNSITGKWKKLKGNLPKINICRKLISDLQENGISTQFIHVKAHTKKTDFISLNNDIVDSEARRQANNNDKPDKCT